MKISLLSLVIILFLKCNNDNSNDFSLKVHSANKKIKIDDTINISVDNKNEIKIDSIQFLLNKTEINSNHILNNTNTGAKTLKQLSIIIMKKLSLIKKLLYFLKFHRNYMSIK